MFIKVNFFYIYLVVYRKFISRENLIYNIKPIHKQLYAFNAKNEIVYIVKLIQTPTNTLQLISIYC